MFFFFFFPFYVYFTALRLNFTAWFAGVLHVILQENPC